jgi:hypothetical protein
MPSVCRYIDIASILKPHRSIGFRVVVRDFRRFRKSQIYVVLFLCAISPAMSATTIVAIWTQGRIIVAADSKVNGGFTRLPSSMCKIFQFPDAFVAVQRAGLCQVLSGTTADQARTLVGAMDEMILGVIVTPNG